MIGKMLVHHQIMGKLGEGGMVSPAASFVRTDSDDHNRTLRPL